MTNEERSEPRSKARAALAFKLILQSEPDKQCFLRLGNDLAEAVCIAARDGEDAATEYLIQLAKEAAPGKYRLAAGARPDRINDNY